MIKINSTIVGEVYNTVKTYTAKDGKQYQSIKIQTKIPSASDLKSQVEIFLYASAQKDKVSFPELKIGDIIEAKGEMMLKKVEKGDSKKTYINLNLEEIKVCEHSESIKITATMDFRGTVGKSVQQKVDKKGRPFITFSAYSLVRKGDNKQFFWVHFIQFNTGKPDYLDTSSKIIINGELEVKSFNDDISLNCRVIKMERDEQYSSYKVEEEQTPSENAVNKDVLEF